MLGSNTPKLIPNDAMMNENSPICVNEKPVSIATFNDCPVTNIPNAPNTIIPTITTADNSNIGPAYSAIVVGCTIIPTDMKNTAPNRSLTGIVTRSMRSA